MAAYGYRKVIGKTEDKRMSISIKYLQEGQGVKYKGRAQCLVIRDGKVLMVKHTHENDEWYCSPGGGIEDGETPEQAAIRELNEKVVMR